jgi:dUTP pyrophosphatase
MKTKKIVKVQKSWNTVYDMSVKNNHTFVYNGTVLHNCCYRGEIRIILENTGDEPITIKDGDRIAQMVLVPVLKCGWQKVSSKESLSNTDRGTGGFGSTGTK